MGSMWWSIGQHCYSMRYIPLSVCVQALYQSRVIYFTWNFWTISPQDHLSLRRCPYRLLSGESSSCWVFFWGSDNPGCLAANRSNGFAHV